MLVLDRYIAARFVRALFVSLLVFLAIFLIVDLVEHLDEFIDAHAETGQVLRYYLNYIPFIVVTTLPVSMLLATLFSVGALSKANELVAMRASGISLWRSARPLLVIAMVISLGTMAFAELVVPGANQARWEIKRIEIEKQQPRRKTIVYDLYRQGEEDRVFRFERYDIPGRHGFGVMIQRFDGNALISTIRAQEMLWEDSIWILTKGEERRFTRDDSVLVRSFERDPRPAWRERPEFFAQAPRREENLSYFDLAARAANKERSGSDATVERVGMQFKLAFPFSCFMMVLLGIPIASTPKRAGFAKSFGIAVGIGFVYFTFTDVLQSLGKAGDLSPYVAAWTMNLLFLVVGILLFTLVRD